MSHWKATMNSDVAKKPRCPACRSTDLEQVTYPREFRPRGKRVVVEMLALRCASCGTESTRAAQHNENLARLKKRKAEYGGLLLGEEFVALRRRYGITQQAAAKIFGKGKIAFSRYENEVSYPDETTTDLLQLAIDRPEVIKWLADRKRVELPLWDRRCDEERRQKLRLMSDVRAPDASAKLWATAPVRASAGRPAAFSARCETVLDAFSPTAEVTAGNEDRFDATGAAYG
jgi:putative zinc finger/helix-turn-helix YgiT family protein